LGAESPNSGFSINSASGEQQKCHMARQEAKEWEEASLALL
jgi:hypothetical protein